jgi:hypothetical protein
MCSYVITAVAQGNATVTNSFFLAGTTEEDKRFELERIEVAEAFEPSVTFAESKKLWARNQAE